jgi:hypothetical protein
MFSPTWTVTLLAGPWMVIWPVYEPGARFSAEGSAVTVSGSGVVPLRGETLSQSPPEFVERETVN